MLTRNNTGTKGKWLQKNGYEFSGLFYRTEDGTNCRMTLDFKEKDCGLTNPDLMVIMMNPGSSHPEPAIKSYPAISNEIFFPTHPDPTQWRVVDFMQKHKYYYARVINLSDLCNPASCSLKKDAIQKHSLFLKWDRKYLKKYFQHETDILLAWGAKKIFHYIAHEALSFAITNLGSNNKVYGAIKESDDLVFYHPLYKRKKHGWLNNVKQLDRRKLLTGLSTRQQSRTI